MGTVTIGRDYFEALLRRAEFHTAGLGFDTTASLSNNVTISKAEHDYLINAVREYNLLKSALFKGGLSIETLNTLLSSEQAISGEPSTYPYQPAAWEDCSPRAAVPVTISLPYAEASPPTSDDTTIDESGIQPRKHSRLHDGVHSYDQRDSMDMLEQNEVNAAAPRVPPHNQRTLLVTNLSDRTTHKDLAEVVRGGRLLNIFLRNDRSATISFVEGAADFLAYAKRNDIYLHTKRLEFRWNDKQFKVSTHVFNKIANGATRNLVIRGAAGKLTADQIRDHLDHIHNLVVVDVFFIGGDAHVSTNSIHNALFARTCMMSRTCYKNMKIDWYQDECAAPLPQPQPKPHSYISYTPRRTLPVSNRYTLLDTGSDFGSDSEDGSLMTSGIQVSNHWADAAAA